ncbi:MAG: hypothetical protein QOD14_2317, partial [Solirubrobacterales bacterium]|nr:hypothetical protein [Solirubrobacterales bacterium]
MGRSDEMTAASAESKRIERGE